MDHEFITTADIEAPLQPTYLQLACVVVCWQEHILCIHRLTEPFKGYWSIPGGHVEPGEGYKIAALRELHEEVGVQAASLAPFGTFISHTHQLESHIFALHSPDGAAHNAEPDKHTIAWKTIPEALELPLTPGLREALPILQ